MDESRILRKINSSGLIFFVFHFFFPCPSISPLIPTRRMFDLIPIMQMKTSLNISAESPYSLGVPQGPSVRFCSRLRRRQDRHCVAIQIPRDHTNPTHKAPLYVHQQQYFSFFSAHDNVRCNERDCY